MDSMATKYPHVTFQFDFLNTKFLHVQLEASVAWKKVRVMHVE
jgi:hypothetical protein